jgi:hypothetical protein
VYRLQKSCLIWRSRIRSPVVSFQIVTVFLFNEAILNPCYVTETMLCSCCLCSSINTVSDNRNYGIMDVLSFDQIFLTRIRRRWRCSSLQRQHHLLKSVMSSGRRFSMLMPLLLIMQQELCCCG